MVIMSQTIQSKSYSNIRDYYYRSLKKIKKMLEKTGIALGRTQSRAALQCYGKLLKGHEPPPQAGTPEAPPRPEGPDKEAESASRPVPSQEVLTKPQSRRPEEQTRLTPAAGSAATMAPEQVATVPSEREGRPARRTGLKDVATQDNLLAATIFQEDYQK